MRTIRLTVAYDGTAYAGWQIQPNAATVQAELEKAIEKITGKRSRATASGRTDAGVHALGQVVAFRTGSAMAPEVLCRALGAELPDDIAVLDAREVPECFHPIRDAARKRYRYVIHDCPVRDVFSRRYAWHYGRPLDAEAMQRAASALLGKHDFTSFAASGSERTSNVRTIFVLSVARGQGGQAAVIAVEIEADGFLYNMARAIVGTLVEVGRGAQEEAWPAQVLSARDRAVAGPTAPPQGLFLVKVDYPPSCESPTSSRD